MKHVSKPRVRWLLPVFGLGLVLLLSACDDVNTVDRPDEPLVLTGADLADLVGENPGDIVAFAHSRPGDVPTWTQIPVQVDQRRSVDFGSQPATNTTAGATGTVYGTSPIGVTALQYADPGTWVGADPDATFDADDELVFMVGDAGGRPRDGEEHEPAGVVPGSGVRVQLDDPLGDDEQAWVYLFLSATGHDPSAGVDYVDYDFALTSGAYKTTYKRADGPNPETSSVTTDTYTVGLTDRWIENEWRIHAGDASGVDILDGVKNQFATSTCVRSNATFADAEGAFVANIDGPVRAIRSYVGANSGPLTQRTHVFYRDQLVTTTDLRVHAIPGIMDYLDLSAAAAGMSYRNSENPAGVTIDGSPDAISTALPDWELATGTAGSVMVTSEVRTSIEIPGGIDAAADHFYRDETTSPVLQCWGEDPHLYGASGLHVVTGIPDTDPRSATFDTFSADRIVRFAPPGGTGTDADAWATETDTPLTVTVTDYTP